MISSSYSRISLSDIANKLGLDSAEDAEFIVSKVSDQLSSRKYRKNTFKQLNFSTPPRKSSAC